MLNNSVVREYAWASLVTFIVAFATALAATDAPMDNAALFGIAAAAAREGGRAVLNLLVTKFSTVSSRPK